MFNAHVASIGSVNMVTYSGRPYEIQQVAVNASSSGDNTLVAATSGKIIYVLDYVLERTSAVTIRIKASDGTVLHGPCGPSATGGGQLRSGLIAAFKTPVGTGLVLNLSSAVQVGGSLTYILVYP